MLATLLDFYTKNVLRYFVRNRGAKVVTMLGFFAVLSFLIVLMHESFYYGFKYIAHDDFFKEALTLYIIELFLLISFMLVFASALLSGVTQLFRTGNNGFVMASPHYDLKSTLTLSRMILTSLWPLVVIIIPALFALHRVFGLSFLGFFTALLSTVLLVVFAVLLALVCIFVIGILLKQFGLFSKQHLIEMTLLASAYLAGYVLSKFRGVDLVKFFQARLLDVETPDLSPILAQFHFFPSHLSALTVYYGMHHQNGAAFSALVFLLFLFTLAYTCYLIVRRSHLALWQRSEEKNSSAHSWLGMLSHRLLRNAKGAERVILRKEIVLFMRDARGMLWFGFILFIWMIQIASSHLLVHGLHADRVATAQVPGFVGLLQFATIIYFIALFVLRFAFPTFSMERKTSWIIRMSPVDMRQVFAAKLAFYVLLFGALALLFSLGSIFTVGFALPLGVPFLLGIMIATFFLTTFGLALGALYPNQDTDDPEELSTSMPGIGFIFISLLYGLTGAYAFSHFITTGSAALYVGFIFGSVLLMLFFVRIARSSLIKLAVN